MEKAVLYLDNDSDGKDKRNMGVNMQVERQHVLTKKEKAVMRVIYQEAEKQNGSCLLTPIDIFEKFRSISTLKRTSLTPRFAILK